MLATLLFLAAAQGQGNPPLLDPGEDPPRLRTALPNGSTVLVEPAPKAKSLTVHLFAGSKGVDETKTSGMRHLLEHLCVKGSDGKLDVRLESQAAFLSARVLRDALDVEIQTPPDQIKLALDALKDVLAAKGWDAAMIAHEAGIIEQERDIRDDESKFSSALWASVYGGNGADPVGDLATIKATTPEALEAERKATFSTENMVLVIEGPITLKEGTLLGADFLRQIPASKADANADRSPVGKPSRAVLDDAFGEADALAVPPITDPKCAATLCAALAIASEVPDAFVTYTPSSLPGLVIVGETGNIGHIGKAIDAINTEGADGWFERGRALGSRWAAQQVATPDASAFTRGLLMSRDVSVRFEMVQNLMVHLSLADFRAAISSFAKHEFVAVGQPQ
jgi:hypothetical protein